MFFDSSGTVSAEAELAILPPIFLVPVFSSRINEMMTSLADVRAVATGKPVPAIGTRVSWR